MLKVSRARRAELARTARVVRQRCQRAGWHAERIATAIRDEAPQLSELEAWRLAYGWSREQVIEGIGALYRANDLAPPPINSAMLCRWEHGTFQPSPEYGQALCSLYRASPDQLGLPTHTFLDLLDGRGSHWYGRSSSKPIPRRNEADMSASDDYTPLTAIRDSIRLALDVEGAAGGSSTREEIAHAVTYYDLNYPKFPPAALAAEIHRTRAMVTSMLNHPQAEDVRAELRRLAGWLTALLGNLAFHLDDLPAAHIHLGTAARLGTDVGENRLTGWALGAQSMAAYYQDRPEEALELAEHAYEFADTPLRRAQVLSWARLRALAHMGRSSEANRVLTDARHEMDADPHGELPGRFGFDLAEMHLHMAEAHLLLGDNAAARAQAEQSKLHTNVGRPGWAAAMIVHARGEVARRNVEDAAALAGEVLDTIDPAALRANTRDRLTKLDTEIAALGAPAANAATRQLHERLAELPPLHPVPRTSSEPNGN